jgi:hypothetical protein
MADPQVATVALEAMQLTKAAIAVVRPDGYIGWI